MRKHLSETWIPVEISDGMFSSEYSVGIKLADGKKISIFVDKDLIKEEGNRKFLKVYVIEESKERKKVLLPSEAFETSTRWAEVAA